MGGGVGSSLAIQTLESFPFICHHHLLLHLKDGNPGVSQQVDHGPDTDN